MEKADLRKGYGKAGRALIKGIADEMAANGLEPDAIESEALRLAAGLADRHAELADTLKSEGMMITSPTGVVKAHPALVECRQCEIAIARILSSVAIADTTSAPKSARHVRAGLRSAAATRKRRGQDG